MIVLISDDTIFAQMLQYELEEHFPHAVQVYPAQAAQLTEEALQSAALTVLDINIPGSALQKVFHAPGPGASVPLILFGYTDVPSTVPGILAQEAQRENMEFFSRPFSVRQFLLRVNTLLSPGTALQQSMDVSEDAKPLTVLPPLQLIEEEYSVRCGTKLVRLSKREYEVLAYLLKKRGQTVSRAELFSAVWAGETAKSNIVDVYIRYLRKKMDAAFHMKIIYSVRGIGYTIPRKNKEVYHYAERDS